MKIMEAVAAATLVSGGGDIPLMDFPLIRNSNIFGHRSWGNFNNRVSRGSMAQFNPKTGLPHTHARANARRLRQFNKLSASHG